MEFSFSLSSFPLMFLFLILADHFYDFIYKIQDLKKKERELMAKEAELNRREQVYNGPINYMTFHLHISFIIKHANNFTHL